MNGLLHLGEKDFYIEQGQKGPVVCTSLKGIVFVFFHADKGQCHHCDLADPEFSQLPQFVSGSKFACCNLYRCPMLQQKSLQTITPFKKVPAFIVFVNGKPFMNYEGERTLKHFAEFMQNVFKILNKQQSFNNGQKTSSNVEPVEKTPFGIAYDYDYITVTDASVNGSLTCSDDGVCYFTSGEINQKPKPSQPTQSVPQHQMEGYGQYNPNQVAMHQQMKAPGHGGYIPQHAYPPYAQNNRQPIQPQQMSSFGHPPQFQQTQPQYAQPQYAQYPPQYPPQFNQQPQYPPQYPPQFNQQPQYPPQFQQQQPQYAQYPQYPQYQ